MPTEVGSVVEGVVTGITHFGAFIQLPDGKTGLVHISEIADTYVRDIKDFLQEQDHVKVKVLTADDHGKIGLSIKQADPTWSGNQTGPRGPRNSRGPRRFSENFEDKLARFVKDSDERQSQLRRATDSKRGGRGSGRRF